MPPCRQASANGNDGVYGLASEGEYIRRKLVKLRTFRDELLQLETEGYAVDGVWAHSHLNTDISMLGNLTRERY